VDYAQNLSAGYRAWSQGKALGRTPLPRTLHPQCRMVRDERDPGSGGSNRSPTSLRGCDPLRHRMTRFCHQFPDDVDAGPDGVELVRNLVGQIGNATVPKHVGEMVHDTGK
jgi:hypothetical protein